MSEAVRERHHHERYLSRPQRLREPSLRMSKFYQQYFCIDDDFFSLIIEDNGKVAYAYLLKKRNIISDVWLYNQQTTPSTVDWTNKKDLPFLNPKNYILNNRVFSPIKNQIEVKIKWDLLDEAKRVRIYIRNELIAVLGPNLFPGYSSLVCKDGPLAKKINI